MRLILVLTLLIPMGISIAYADEEHHSMEVEEQAQTEAISGICPVMGGPISEEYSYEYEGKTYYFCCPMCIDKFKENPELYISDIEGDSAPEETMEE